MPLLHLLGAFALFVIVPVLAILGSWKKLEPATRRLLITLYLATLAMFAGLYGLIDRWSSSGL